MATPRYAIGTERSSGGVSVLALDIDSGEIPFVGLFPYDDHFGDRYDIEGGLLRSGLPSGEKHASQAMLLDAKELAYQKLPPEIRKYARVLKEDDMQHALGLTRNLAEGLGRMDPRKSISENLAACLAVDSTHTWMDRTTGRQVEYLETRMEPYGGMVAQTGNRAEHRFPAAQILKLLQERPDDYRRVELFQTLSAFGTSVDTGIVAPADTGDGWGTNLNTLNIQRPGWNRLVADTIEPRLLGKLGSMADYDTVAGKVSQYLVRRFGFPAYAEVLLGTGDNPAYLLGFFLSAGHSWTVNGELPFVTVSNGEDNIFGCKRGGVMSLVCFTNGGKLHKKFRDQYAGGDWDRYHQLGRKAEPWQHLMLPYLDDESVPRRRAGILRQGFDDTDPSRNIRALYDSQVLAARLHSQHMKLPEEIWVVGGGGKSPILLKDMADVFGRPVKTLEQSEYAAVLGNAIAGAAHVLDIPYVEAVRLFARELPGSRTEPDLSEPTQARISDALRRYAGLERRAA